MNTYEDNTLSGIDKYDGSFEQDELGVTQIPTETIRLLNDFTLLGLFTFLASCPNNWKLNVRHLSSHFNCNKDKIYKAIDGLIELKLLTRTQGRLKGKFIKYHYRLHLRQTVHPTPCLEKPDTVKPDTVNPDTYKTNNLKNKESTTTSSSSISEILNHKEHVLNTPAQTGKTPAENERQKKERIFREEALSDEKCISVYNLRFTEVNVTIEELYDECVDYWSQKDQMVYKARFLTHLRKAPLEKYQDYKPKKEAPSRLISPEEMKTVTDYVSHCRGKRQPSDDMKKEVDRIKGKLRQVNNIDSREALSSIEKEEEILFSGVYVNLIQTSAKKDKHSGSFMSKSAFAGIQNMKRQLA